MRTFERVTAALLAAFWVVALVFLFTPKEYVSKDLGAFQTAAVVLKPKPPPPPPPPPPVDETLEAVELELGSRLVGVAPGEAHVVAKVLVEEARRHGFDPWFIVAVIEAESDYHVEACSPTGALGLMQLMPSTFRTVSNHYRMTDPVENVRAGIAYLGKLFSAGFRYPVTILRGYNGGPASAVAYHKALRAKEDVSSFPLEMVEYPGKVLARYRRLVHAAGGDHKHPEKTWRLQ